MTRNDIQVERPQRWESRFGDAMTETDVLRLLSMPPFRDMDARKFPAATPLAGILLNDTRLTTWEDGDVVLREGDYGNSAFLVVEGRVRVVLKNLPRSSLGRPAARKRGWFATLWNSLSSPKYPEVRRYGAAVAAGGQATAGRGRIFLQDVPHLLGPDDTVLLSSGEVFGEMAALSRSPRTATVVSEGRATLLEIRWQGLRELLRADAAWKAHVDRLYRQNSLRAHLRETPLFAHLANDELEQLADATEFANYGHFDWHRKFDAPRRHSPEELEAQIASEPLIVAEGDYSDGLLLIRSGFARMSVRNGHGHQTLAYLGKGDVFGWDELVAPRGAGAASGGASSGWRASLRAIGYVDVLRIPTHVAERFLAGRLSAARSAAAPKPPPAPSAAPSASPTASRSGDARTDCSAGLLEFLVDGRLNNGTQAMVIDLDRCTRCDDCLRACAATHDGNPRFNREGPKHGNLMFTQACMHCVDPVCMIGCPTGAIGRDEATGNILINDETCIGCSTCANSCPYQNIRMVEIRDPSGAMFLDTQGAPIVKATKCDLCVGQWGGPACQRACPHDALVRIDLRDPRTLAEWSGA